MKRTQAAHAMSAFRGGEMRRGETRACRAVLAVLLLSVLLGGMLLRPRVAGAVDVMFPRIVLPHVDMVGVGMGFYPQFAGSTDYYFGAAPVARVYFSGDRYFQLLINELRCNVLDHGNWSFGPLALWRFGRYDVDDNVVDRMQTIDDTVELGGFLGYSLTDPDNPLKHLNFETYAQADVGGVHEGWLASASVNGFYPLVEFLTFAGGAATTWASEGYNDTYFGVDPGDAVRSGLETYSPGAGMRDARGYMGLILHLSMNWHVGGGVLYSHILSQDADSPIVTERGDPNQWVYGMGVLYSW